DGKRHAGDQHRQSEGHDRPRQAGGGGDAVDRAQGRLELDQDRSDRSHHQGHAGEDRRHGHARREVTDDDGQRRRHADPQGRRDDDQLSGTGRVAIALGLLKKITAQSAAEIAAQFALGDVAKTLLTPTLSPGDFLEALIREAQWPDAVRCVAHALPPRAAVWWACTCARFTLAVDLPPDAVAALQAAEAWVFQPTEENRRAAMQRAEAAGFDTPAAWSAVSVFWS